ncbi:glycosyltransferase family 4 protein [Vibrio breoganii]
MKIILLGTAPLSIYTFRGELVKELVKKGHDVLCMANGATEDDISSIKSLGCRYLDYNVERSGLNPFRDLGTLVTLIRVLRKEKPDVLFSYTIKPILWGGIASRITKICVHIPMVTGLGYAFQKGGWRKRILRTLVKYLYKISLKGSQTVIFQNKDNMQLFQDLGIVSEMDCKVVNGSGVNLDLFKQSSIPEGKIRFLLIARLLIDKGIREYVEAAKIVSKSFPEVEFHLVGPFDPSPNGISNNEIDAWKNIESVTYLGSTKDVRPHIKDCTVYVLPSYHEGLPRTVLEAMAIGRPILTTDVPGCRETTISGINGWLVKKGSTDAIVEKMIWFLNNREMIRPMGERSRNIVEEKFDVNKVNKDIVDIINNSWDRTK